MFLRGLPRLETSSPVNDNQLNKSVLFGPPDRIAVERSLGEFRAGRPVIISSASAIAALPVDGVTDEMLAAFRRYCAPEEPHLIVTARRAQALGLDAVSTIGLSLAARDDAEAVFSLVADTGVNRTLNVRDPGANADAAIELAKLAQRLPALLVADVTGDAPEVS